VAIRSGLAGLQSGGGTILYPAIREAYERLVQSPAAVRHLVILSDGLAEPADYIPLIEAIASDGITVSTVAVGNDAASELMESLAEKGGGRYWYAEDAAEVPRIFASESMIVSRGLVVEGTIFPVMATPAEALEGIDLSLMPPLHGYVMTYPKPTAVEALRSPRGHPLLVYGNHGLGRSVAFTSDLTGGWGRDWLDWDQFPRFIAQSVRWMRRNSGSSDLTLSLYEDSGEVHMVLEARSETGGYLSDLKPIGTVTGPDQREVEVSMSQTAPGRYEGIFRTGPDGIYRAAAGDSAVGLGTRAYWSRAYSPELRAPGIDTAALAAAARVGGGRLLTGLEDPNKWWTVRDAQQKTLADLTIFLTLTALVLFLIDIGLREVPGVRREGRATRAGEEPDMEKLILRGIDDERHKPKHRRPSPAEAARILAERRARRDNG
jgi:Ca-activated chloride channel family protein